MFRTNIDQSPAQGVGRRWARRPQAALFRAPGAKIKPLENCGYDEGDGKGLVFEGGGHLSPEIETK